MSWIRLDDQFADHPKFLDIREDLADAAMAMWARALGYCNKHETDGAIPRGALRQLSYHQSPSTVADELVRVGLWVTTDRGWSIHDYVDYQRTSTELAEQRAATAEQRRQAGLKSAEARRKKRGVEQNVNGTPTDVQRELNKTSTPSPIPVHEEDDPTDHLASPMATRVGHGECLGPDVDPPPAPADGPSCPPDAAHAHEGSTVGLDAFLPPSCAGNGQSVLAHGQRTGKPRRGRRGATGVAPAEQRYRAAYEAGVRDAAPGCPFALPPGKIAGLLGPVLGQHARSHGGPLGGDALDAWICRAAAEFRRAVDGGGQYWNGYGVPGFVRWLNAGRPRSSGTSRSPSRVDDRPEKYGETEVELQARIERGRDMFLAEKAREREARLAAMTPEQRAAEEDLPL